MLPGRVKKRPSRAVLVERLPGYVAQLLLLGAVLWAGRAAFSNFVRNVHALGAATGFGFLRSEAGFDISQSLIPYGPSSSYFDAVVVATLNTALVVAVSGMLSSAVALLVAFGRLSSNIVIRSVASLYVEVFRNIPLLLQIFFWYFTAIALLPQVSDSLTLGAILLNNRGLFLPRLVLSAAGWLAVLGSGIACTLLFIGVARVLGSRGSGARATKGAAAVAILALWLFGLAALGPQFSLDRPEVGSFNVGGGLPLLPEAIALVLGLSIYNSTFLAEIFRAGILSVPLGQSEAAATVGLTGWRVSLLIVLPQALKVALPPAAGQYQTLTKASSLAAAIGYPDIMQIVGGTVLSQTSQALESMALVVLLYAAINLLIALGVGLLNRRNLSRQPT